MALSQLIQMVEQHTMGRELSTKKGMIIPVRHNQWWWQRRKFIKIIIILLIILNNNMMIIINYNIIIN